MITVIERRSCFSHLRDRLNWVTRASLTPDNVLYFVTERSGRVLCLCWGRWRVGWPAGWGWGQRKMAWLITEYTDPAYVLSININQAASVAGQVLPFGHRSLIAKHIVNLYRNICREFEEDMWTFTIVTPTQLPSSPHLTSSYSPHPTTSPLFTAVMTHTELCLSGDIN